MNQTFDGALGLRTWWEKNGTRARVRAPRGKMGGTGLTPGSTGSGRPPGRLECTEAPEQLGDDVVDGSHGRLNTGALANAGSSRGKLVHAIRRGRPPPPRSTSPPVLPARLATPVRLPSGRDEPVRWQRRPDGRHQWTEPRCFTGSPGGSRHLPRGTTTAVPSTTTTASLILEGALEGAGDRARRHWRCLDVVELVDDLPVDRDGTGHAVGDEHSTIRRTPA